MNRTITGMEIETVIKNLPTIKGPGLDCFTGKFYTNFRVLTCMLLKVFQNIAEEGTLPSAFYEAAITLIPKPDKDNTKKENYWPISLMNIDVTILSNHFELLNLYVLCVCVCKDQSCKFKKFMVRYLVPIFICSVEIFFLYSFFLAPEGI